VWNIGCKNSLIFLYFLLKIIYYIHGASDDYSTTCPEAGFGVWDEHLRYVGDSRAAGTAR
jgi:hypothetical protein